MERTKIIRKKKTTKLKEAIEYVSSSKDIKLKRGLIEILEHKEKEPPNRMEHKTLINTDK